MMSNKATASRGCMCGAVRYELTGDPIWRGYCHCHSCRRHTGAPVVAWVTLKSESVKWIKGERTHYESSPGKFRGFCRDRGTPLTWESTLSNPQRLPASKSRKFTSVPSMNRMTFNPPSTSISANASRGSIPAMTCRVTWPRPERGPVMGEALPVGVSGQILPACRITSRLARARSSLECCERTRPIWTPELTAGRVSPVGARNRPFANSP